MLFLFVLLMLRELHPLALFILIECGWLLDSVPLVIEITLVFSLSFIVRVVETGWAVGRVVEVWMPGLCSTCCDFRAMSGSAPQGWVAYTIPWGGVLDLHCCPRSVWSLRCVQNQPHCSLPSDTHLTHSHSYHFSVSAGNGYRYLHSWLLSALWVFARIRGTW